MKLKLIFLLSLVIIASACIGSTANYGAGVKITDFKFVPNSIQDGQTAFLQLAIQNTGTFDVTDGIKITLFGLAQPFNLDTVKTKFAETSPCELVRDKLANKEFMYLGFVWDTLSFKDVKTNSDFQLILGYSGAIAAIESVLLKNTAYKLVKHDCGNDKTNTLSFYPILATQSLKAPNPDLYPDGETKTFDWTYKPDLNLPLDQAITDEASVRVCYPYQTQIRARVDFISSEEFLLQQSKSGISEKSIDYQQTKGPIGVSIDSKQPVIYENEAGTSAIRLKLKVSNIGDGFAVGSCSGTGELDKLEELNKVELKVYEKAPMKGTAGDKSATFSDSRDYDNLKTFLATNLESNPFILVKIEDSTTETYSKKAIFQNKDGMIIGVVITPYAATQLGALKGQGTHKAEFDDDVKKITFKSVSVPDFVSYVCGNVFESGEDQYLKKGESRDVNMKCNFAGLSAPRETRDLALVLEYSYYIDATTSLEIKG